jgi:hypothetical protein
VKQAFGLGLLIPGWFRKSFGRATLVTAFFLAGAGSAGAKEKLEEVPLSSTVGPAFSANELANELPLFDNIAFDLLSVDSLGKVQTLPEGMKKESEWVWLPAADGSDGRFPVLRTWLSLSSPMQLETGVVAEQDRERYTELRSAAGQDSPRGNWYFDSVPGRSSVLIQWRDSIGQHQANLLIRFRRGGKHPVWLHPDCREHGLRAVISDRAKAATVFSESDDYVAIDCLQAEGDGVSRIHVQASRGLKLGGSTVIQASGRGLKDVGTSSKSNRGSISFLTPEFNEGGPPASRKLIAGVELLGALPQEAHFDIGLILVRALGAGRGVPRKPLSWQAGAQFSSLTYTEKTFDGATRAASSEVGLTLKTSVDWRPGAARARDQGEWARWSFGGNIFGTALVLTSTQTGAVLDSTEISNPPRYLGANLKASRRLNSFHSNWDLQAALGVYFWGMLVPSVNYGILGLAGPELILAAHRSARAERQWGGYIKVARPGNGLGFDFNTGRELAIGADYQLNAASSKRRYLLTLDIADTFFSIQTDDRAMSLVSISTGLSVQF